MELFPLGARRIERRSGGAAASRLARRRRRTWAAQAIHKLGDGRGERFDRPRAGRPVEEGAGCGTLEGFWAVRQAIERRRRGRLRRRSTDQRGFTRSTCPCMLYSRSFTPKCRLATRGRARIGSHQPAPAAAAGRRNRKAHRQPKSARWSVFSVVWAAVVWALRTRAEPAQATSREPPTHASQTQRCCTLAVHVAPMQRQHGDRKRKRTGEEEEASGALKASRPSLPQRGTMPHEAAKPGDAGGATVTTDGGGGVVVEFDVDVEFPKDTVSVLWLERFVAEHASELRGKTTSDVSNEILKSRTLDDRIAYVDLLRSEVMDDGSPAVAKANCFVSHAWSTDFLDLAECVINWAKANAEPTPYVWLDVFAVNQHQGEMSSEWWDKTFRAAVRELGHTLLVLTPWNKPVAISRVWCLWEILCTIDPKGCELTILMPEREKTAFADALKESLDDVQRQVAAVDAEHAEAFKSADKERIFAEIRKLHRGFLELNNKVKDRLRDWTYEAGTKVLDEMPAETRAQSDLITSLAEYTRKATKYELSEALYREAVAGRREQLGDEDAQTLAAIGGLGYLLEYQGKCAEAEPFLIEALDGRRRELGNDKRETLQSMNDLGNLYLQRGDFAKAEPLYTEALQGRLATLEPTDYDVDQSYNNMGRLYTKKKEYDKAKEYVEKALAGRRANPKLGPEHATTIFSMTRLAELRAKMGDTDGATGLYNEALLLQSKVLGDDHADTLSTKMHLGELLMSSPIPIRRTKSEQIVRLAQEAHTGFLKTAGEDAKDTQQAAELLRQSQSEVSLRSLTWPGEEEGQRSGLDATSPGPSPHPSLQQQQEEGPPPSPEKMRQPASGTRPTEPEPEDGAPTELQSEPVVAAEPSEEPAGSSGAPE
eukprot:COSAG06_NODE_54_length_27948_cov_234.398671_17_plen_882_part_00